MRLDLLSASEPARRSGIVTFSAPSTDSDRLQAELAKRSVHAIRRGPGIRLSPHFYQGETEMNRLLARIADAIDRAKK
jgi:selenocysteine lyase/cysteine desulfurase